MRLDEARSLKQALRSGGVLSRGADGTGAFEVTAPGAFVGIVPSDRADGYRLAVRLTEPVDDDDGYRAALRELAGDDVDVRFVGPVRALTEEPTCVAPTPGAATVATPEQLQQRLRPLVRGASVAHRDVTAGTIGAFVRVGDGESVHLLSNNHVLANSDRGQPGDDLLQPGPGDGGTEQDRVGALAVAVRLDPGAPNLMDAALGVLDADVEVDLAVHDGPLTGVVEAAEVVGQVAKVGRTSGYTVGRISAVEVDGVPVGYETGVFTFDDQIEVEGIDGSFSAGGDSGSVIYTLDERHGVGLLFAGSTTGGPGGAGVTYANSLATVLAALDASLLQ